MSIYPVCNKLDELDVSPDFGFNAADKKFIERQQKFFKNFRLEEHKLLSYSGSKKKFNFIEVDTSCNAGIITRLSFPLISISRDRVFFKNTEDCHGMLCGQGGKDLYIKQKGRWTKQKSFDRWISQN
ncbi:MAG: hypothetical protein ABI581_11135 [Sediminibacterium sp.]